MGYHFLVLLFNFYIITFVNNIIILCTFWFLYSLYLMYIIFNVFRFLGIIFRIIFIGRIFLIICFVLTMRRINFSMGFLINLTFIIYIILELLLISLNTNFQDSLYFIFGVFSVNTFLLFRIF